MNEDLVNCPLCNCTISARRLNQHKAERCPKSSKAINVKLRKAQKKSAQTIEIQVQKRILVRSRLERLFRDLSLNSASPDEEELAKVFKAFYTMYVWRGYGSGLSASRMRGLDENGDSSNSIRTVSGGLPSLGKRAR